jgi:putative hydrolase of the HAD superfamily
MTARTANARDGAAPHRDRTPGERTLDELRSLLAQTDREIVVWIDFGGVLCPGLGTGMSEVARLLGAPWNSVAAAAQDIARDHGTTGMGPLELGLMRQDDWIDAVLGRLGSSRRAVDLSERFEDVWYRGRTIDRPFYDGLVEIRRSGVPLGVLTNSVAEWEMPRRRMVDLDADFDAIVRSHLVQRMKPHPDIFAHAETLLGGGDAQHVLVDDLERNCVGARNVGWNAIHHTDVVPGVVVP